MLDLSRGRAAPPILRKQTNQYQKAIKYVVPVAPAASHDEIAAYYPIYIDWSRRKGLPIASEKEFHQLFALTDDRLLLLARQQGNIIAWLVIRYCCAGVMEHAANSSSRARFVCGPTICCIGGRSSGGTGKASLNTALVRLICSYANSGARSYRSLATDWTCRLFVGLPSAIGSSIRPCEHAR
jgi:hypothetical protein